jgi:hypothetical protein
MDPAVLCDFDGEAEGCDGPDTECRVTPFFRKSFFNDRSAVFQ